MTRVPSCLVQAHGQRQPGPHGWPASWLLRLGSILTGYGQGATRMMLGCPLAALKKEYDKTNSKTGLASSFCGSQLFFFPYENHVLA